MKVAKIFLISIIILFAVSFAAAWSYLKYLQPSYNGDIRTDEVRGEATVLRDEYGVPHIYSDDAHDLYFALGYAQAQDRLFQMDFYRRAARGLLAEILGKDLLDADRYLRTMGFKRTAAAQLAALPAGTREMVEAFSQGINHFMKHNPLPVEFSILGYRPEEWKPEDSLAIGNLLCFQLASWAYQNELLNYLVLAKLGPERSRLLLPVYPDDAVPIIADAKSAVLSGKSRDFIRNFVLREFASNNWVIGGKLTASGMPLLCEDSHEDGPELPSQWHLVQLKGPGIDTAGAMFPGIPVFIWGHNGNIAWGLTNFNLDNQDLYLEKINPADPSEVMYRGQWVKMTVIEERIPCRDCGGDPKSVLKICITPHGPIINDIEEGIGPQPVSIRRVEAEPWPISEAFYKMSTAKNWSDFKNAVALYAAGPQHIVYADTGGNIGYIGAGKCPVRRNSKGLLPQPGWDGAHEWAGYYPFTAMPSSFNPASGFIVTANNSPVRGKFPIPLSEYWEPPYRAERINALIKAGTTHTVAGMKAMQLDVKSELAARVVPGIVAMLRKTVTGEYKKYLDALAAWDFHAAPGSAPACIYEVLLNRIIHRTFADELGKDLLERLMKDKIAVTNIIADLLLRRQHSPFFDDVTTNKVETCGDVAAAAFRETVDFLKGRLGPDMGKWQWGAIHEIEFSHLFGAEPMLRPLFNYGTFPFGGDDHTINRGGFDKTKPYKVSITASIRYIVDFSNLEDSLVVLSSGQSAHLLSGHRHDMADMFMAGKYINWYMEKKSFEQGIEGVLKFRRE